MLTLPVFCEDWPLRLPPVRALGAMCSRCLLVWREFMCDPFEWLGCDEWPLLCLLLVALLALLRLPLTAEPPATDPLRLDPPELSDRRPSVVRLVLNPVIGQASWARAFLASSSSVSFCGEDECLCLPLLCFLRSSNPPLSLLSFLSFFFSFLSLSLSSFRVDDVDARVEKALEGTLGGSAEIAATPGAGEAPSAASCASMSA
mmetsp:Transcript_7990/g.18536  ORF Transcript_7990/g.18536 Transcript_7990/m.18536 type:complete len:203 (-) Transcript_7990:1006-1614(-)